MKRRILFSMLCAAIAANAFAQGQGLAGINEATSLMTSYFDPATKLCYAIGAVLVGRRYQDLWQVLQRRPRHVEDRGELVLRLYLPDCGGYHPAFLLPLTAWSIR